MGIKFTFVSCSILLCLVLVNSQTPNYKVNTVTGYTPVATSNNSTLYQVQLATPAYEWPIYLVDLHGSRYNMGYDYGVFFGKYIPTMYTNFLAKIIGDSFEDQVLIDVIGPALDWQWADYLSVEVPIEFMEELDGITAAGNDMGIPDLGSLIIRIIVMANAPGNQQDWLIVLAWEFEHQVLKKDVKTKPTKKSQPVEGLQCSMFGVWGSRTTDGSVYTARNLDWNPDTGISHFKLLTVYNPIDGKYPHVSVGWAGLAGALAGMSSQGLTVHEANLEEAHISLDGFPWVLRLRYIMENAYNLATAKVLWEKTNNTMGFNHMIGSASDAKSMCIETMYGYSAYFEDDDPREADATMIYKGNNVQIGFPLQDAVWRTNHGYDPIIRKNYEWALNPTVWSMQRYMFAHEAFTKYASSNVLIGQDQAINVTSILGDKGPDPYFCMNNNTGSNVLSVTFHPSTSQMWVAWEDGHNTTWRPAACNSYIEFDMSVWWKSK